LKGILHFLQVFSVSIPLKALIPFKQCQAVSAIICLVSIPLKALIPFKRRLSVSRLTSRRVSIPLKALIPFKLNSLSDEERELLNHLVEEFPYPSRH